MTYDDNLHRDELLQVQNNSSSMEWYGGIAVGILLIAGLMYAGSGDRTNTASTIRPTATAPATTAGSGAVQPRNPAGNVQTTPPERQ